jgi:hypothetical protein
MTTISGGREVRYLAAPCAVGAGRVTLSQWGVLDEVRGAWARVRWRDVVNGLREPVWERVEHLAPVTPQSGSDTVVNDLLAWSVTLKAQGYSAAALAVYGRVLALDPHNVTAWNLNAFALVAVGRYAEALDAYDLALALDPTNGRAKWNKARLLQALGRHE